MYVILYIIRCSISVESRKKVPPPKEKYEMVLIRPEKRDIRNNEQIEDEILKGLNNVRKKLNVQNVRQMRKQCLAVEVMDQSDVETIRWCKLNKIGFVVERPKKVNPSVIIYDVETEYKEEELKEDLIRKNLDCISDCRFEEMKSMVKFVHNFKFKDGKRINWIIQLSTKLYELNKQE